MWTFEFPSMPPVGLNHMHKRTWTGEVVTVKDMARWQQGAKLMLLGWEPPRNTRLAVTVLLRVPRNLIGRIDAGKWAEPVVDVVIGARRDQWVYRQTAEKTEGDGSVLVIVEEMGQEEG